MKRKILIAFMLILITNVFSSCLSIAKLSDFPESSDRIDFDKYAKDYHSSHEPFWTFETSNEYYLESTAKITEDQLIVLIKTALTENAYYIYNLENRDKCVIGKRGLRANEWGAITCIYYRFVSNESKAQIYINSRITQDITGGWKENRAKKVGLALQKHLQATSSL